MSSQPRVAFSADAVTNVFSLAYSDQVGVADMSAVENEVRTAIRDLRPGFSLLTDLSKLESMDPLCVPSIERTMDLFREHGVKLIVRVIPDPKRDIGFNIMSLFHYPHTVRIVTVTTAAEAARALR
jgi:hypothetical protein